MSEYQRGLQDALDVVRGLRPTFEKNPRKPLTRVIDQALNGIGRLGQFSPPGPVSQSYRFPRDMGETVSLMLGQSGSAKSQTYHHTRLYRVGQNEDGTWTYEERP